MKKLFIASAVTAISISSQAQAVELAGAYIDLGYSTFTDSDLGDVFNLNGSAEVAFTRMFSTQLDLGGYRFDNPDDTATSWTLHGNLHSSQNTSFGAFYGEEELDGTDFDFYGVEAGFDVGEADFEAYLGRQELSDFSDIDGTLFGISISADLADRWELKASYDLVDNVLGILDYDLYAVGANYAATDYAQVYGEIGVAHISSPIVSGSTNEAYVGVGVRFTFGNERATTFGRRGVFDKLPGL